MVIWIMAHCIVVGDLSKRICSTLKSKPKHKNVQALRYRVNKSPALVSILTQINPAYPIPFLE
jgi:hypothetical protein